ncbi:50S ribosomal protein L3 [Candidatus Uhrbacteria bacterium RIFCSPHIGHO2_12_FULL_57_11]|uniref:Large ribosomal subunit protein uL3 n=2 Tax=Candidatus Uhriibacteriota TaxID=1752732 RepID=A0A1F7UJT4_9BACT|nr:MAG: 50S ribosomal protein L3 [Candidatus Uhrbacteria bacterium RIFCSPHIGHO2_02_FULL_57_19]OGL78532.1 MAG: 50S ribosomal protein L3 [Candidatus Uhrbacteria bacterium RIFCSPHIGHO2_12_FULL_57_11]
MKFILAKKIQMEQRFRPNGTVVPVTLLEAGPCTVTQVRNAERDGYVSVQVGFGSRRKLARPQAGHAKGLPSHAEFREFRLDDASKFDRGGVITAETFVPGDLVTVTGISKGRGFAGVVKRHGFHGHPPSHGHKDQERMPGSIGSKRQGPVAKGKRMAGRMGGERTTVKNLEVIEVDQARNLIAVKGAVPGARGTLLLVSAEGEMAVEVAPTAAPNA